MRCVDRRLNAKPGADSYEVHVSFDSFMSLYLRIMKGEDGNKIGRQLIALYEAVQFLLTPDTCYHSFIESYFEPEERPKSDCERFCWKCLGKFQTSPGV